MHFMDPNSQDRDDFQPLVPPLIEIATPSTTQVPLRLTDLPTMKGEGGRESRNRAASSCYNEWDWFWTVSPCYVSCLAA
jgi:hypothetical protein